MQKNNFEGNTLENAIEKAIITLQEKEENLLINKITKNKENIEIEVIEKRLIKKYIKEQLYRLLRNMGFIAEIEIVINDSIPTYTIYSSNDSLLIGKNGKNLSSLTTIMQAMLKQEILAPYKFSINVANYNEKRVANLIKLANNVAKEVEKSKIPAQLDSMNSYERMIIHNALKNHANVYTESKGEEPNRYITINPKEN